MRLRHGMKLTMTSSVVSDGSSSKTHFELCGAATVWTLGFKL